MLVFQNSKFNKRGGVWNKKRGGIQKIMKKKFISKLSNNKNVIVLAHHSIAMCFNPFSTNVPLMDKPGGWFLLAKCLKNICGGVTF